MTAMTTKGLCIPSHGELLAFLQEDILRSLSIPFLDAPLVAKAGLKKTTGLIESLDRPKDPNLGVFRIRSLFLSRLA